MPLGLRFTFYILWFTVLRFYQAYCTLVVRYFNLQV